MKGITTYLDYNASAPLYPEVIEIATKLMSKPHNASSVHGLGREGRKHIENARTHIANLVGAEREQIIFNSGATEGNNTVLNHFARTYSSEQILISSIEHLSVLEALPENQTKKIKARPDGTIDLDHLETLLNDKKTSLVSIMLVNNETGVIQPIKEAAALAHRYGALVHSDCVQAAGRININMAEYGIDFLTLSAHKIGGPQGVGALALGACGITPTLLHGGGQEKKRVPVLKT